MKTQITPIRLKNMLVASFGNKKAQVSDAAIIQFTPEGVAVNCQLASDIYVLAKYNKSYFNEYQVPLTNEFLMITKALMDEIDTGYTAEKINFETTDEHIVISEPSEGRVRVQIEAVDKSKITPFELVNTEVGIVPGLDGKKSSFIAQMLVSTDKFMKVKAENVTLVFDGTEFTLELTKDLSDRTQKVTIVRLLPDAKPFRLEFILATLQGILSQFTGDVWLGINETGVCVSQKNADYSLTYLLGRLTEKQAQQRAAEKAKKKTKPTEETTT